MTRTISTYGPWLRTAAAIVAMTAPTATRKSNRFHPSLKYTTNPYLQNSGKIKEKMVLFFKS
jgi:hypothetical protein